MLKNSFFLFTDQKTLEWVPFPTPHEFAEYFIDEIPKMGDVLNVNRHFAAQFTQCPFCSLHFDQIGRKENFFEDIDLLFSQLHLKDKLSVKLAQNSHPNLNETELARNFFSQIPKRLNRKIFDYYQLDFDLFGYDKNEALDYVELGTED